MVKLFKSFIFTRIFLKLYPRPEGFLMFSSFFKLSWKHGKAVLNIFFLRGLAKTDDDGDLSKNKSNKMKKNYFLEVIDLKFKMSNQISKILGLKVFKIYSFLKIHHLLFNSFFFLFFFKLVCVFVMYYLFANFKI